MRNGQDVGVVRFDMEEEGSSAEVSIFLAMSTGNVDIGGRLLRAAEQWLRESRPNVKQLRACVLRDNERSRRLFLGARYLIDSEYYIKSLE